MGTPGGQDLSIIHAATIMVHTYPLIDEGWGSLARVRGPAVFHRHIAGTSLCKVFVMLDEGSGILLRAINYNGVVGSHPSIHPAYVYERLQV